MGKCLYNGKIYIGVGRQLQRRDIEMRTLRILSFLLIFFLIGCNPTSSTQATERDEIIEWAKKISSTEKSLSVEIEQIGSIMWKLKSQPRSNGDISQLSGCYNNITSLYNNLLSINPPVKAKSIHDKYVESYAQAANSVLYYINFFSSADISLFQNSVLAAQEANRIGSEGYNELIALLDEYSISCEEIDYCEME